MRTIALALTALLVARLVERPALAEQAPSSAPPDEAKWSAAKQAFATGKSAFDRGEFETALAEFQRADSLATAAKLSYDIGTCLERLGRYADAAINFERYLARAGVATTDDDKQFADNLRARIAADRTRAREKAAPAPSTAPMPQPLYIPYVPQGYGYYSSQAPMPEAYRRQQIKLQHARRSRAIALMVVGLTLNIGGAAVTAYAFVHDGSTVDQVLEGLIGLSAVVTGIPLWIPGAVSFAQSNAQLKELSKPDDSTPKHALIFSLPVLRF